MVIHPWRHGLGFGRADDGSVVVQKRAYGRDDIGAVLPADTNPDAPVMYEHHIPPAEFAALVAQLGELGSPVNTPGAAPAVVSGEDFGEGI